MAFLVTLGMMIVMKRVLAGTALAVLSMGAQAEGHYSPGIEGIRAGTVPPPGTYYVGYLVNYDVDSLKAPGSDSDIPLKNTGSVSAAASRIAHVTNKKFLGADFGMETVIPILRKDFDFEALGYDDDETAIADIYLSPLALGWHGPRWDASASLGVWLDTADADNLVDAGNGYNSYMISLGGTAYFGNDREVSVSALSRYELHGDNDAGFEPGDQLTLEWGIGKRIMPGVDVGLVGYDQWQTTDDKGTGASNETFSKHAIGVEVTYQSMLLGGFIEAAYYNEYHVEAGTAPASAGDILRVALVKIF